jgi:hypothetical protein
VQLDKLTIRVKEITQTVQTQVMQTIIKHMLVGLLLKLFLIIPTSPIHNHLKHPMSHWILKSYYLELVLLLILQF